MCRVLLPVLVLAEVRGPKEAATRDKVVIGVQTSNAAEEKI